MAELIGLPLYQILTHATFFFGGYLKAKVWAGNPKMIDELKGAITRGAITREVRQIPIAILENVTSGFSNSCHRKRGMAFQAPVSLIAHLNHE